MSVFLTAKWINMLVGKVEAIVVSNDMSVPLYDCLVAMPVLNLAVVRARTLYQIQRREHVAYV